VLLGEGRGGIGAGAGLHGGLFLLLVAVLALLLKRALLLGVQRGLDVALGLGGALGGGFELRGFDVGHGGLLQLPTAKLTGRADVPSASAQAGVAQSWSIGHLPGLFERP